jgi:hypothetical protein
MIRKFFYAFICPSSFALLVAVSTFGNPVQSQDLDFNRDIRPILSDKCFFCHGPDEDNREADLRLDVREDAIDYLEGGDVMDRVFSDDEDLVMPPPETNLSLTDKEKQTLKNWIEQGASYDEHWAFKRLPESVQVPSPKKQGWASQPLDKFVLARIEAAGLEPNRPARPLQWLRRATLDLTGLPPTQDEILAFEKAVSKTGEDAYKAAADRLLASTSFGEHFSIAWLDAARYADSYGYQSDKLNTQWPYRDWVVKAFNDNLPYDKFLTWQLAGDLLENPTQEQILATAFNRIHRLNNEGGAVFEEWRIENVADRVHTFGTAVLGLTMECCRCHDHKYDPISMREYYSLGAFFNSIDESGVYDRTDKVPCPSILLPTPEHIDTMRKATDALRASEKNYAKVSDEAEQRFAKWKNGDQKSLQEALQIPGLRLALGFDQEYVGKKLKKIYHPSESDRNWTSMPELIPVEDCQVPRLPKGIAADSSKPDDDGNEEEKLATETARLAMKLDGERGITTSGIAPFDRWAPFSVVVTLRDTKRTSYRSVIAHHTRGTDCGYNGWDLTIENGHLESRLARVWPGNAISVRTVSPIPKDKWQQVSATYDGSSKADGLKLFLDGKPLKTEVIRDEIKKSANVVVDHGGEFVVGQRFRARGFDGGLIDDVRVYERDLTSSELVHLATGKSIDPTFEYFLKVIDSEAKTAKEKLTSAREAFVMAEEVMVEIPIMREMETSRPAHVLARGLYDAPRDDSTLVTRDTFKNFALPYPEDAPRDRLGLAQWVTNPNHPLTARVAINRFWANFFADPLVRTPENFGVQGELPTHPELLDWLSRDFIANGWDVKRFCKQVVLSATYRQDSSNIDNRIQKDPENRLLARGPSNRLAAEQIRDVALFASGLMVDKLGGPPVSPYQPGEDLWRESNSMSPPFKQSVGKALHRRSLYSVWKRTAPLPNMLAFDATTREVCTVKRSRTNTPLQALVLMNDPQFVEAARVLAESVMGEKNVAERMQAAFMRLAGRSADGQEMTALKKLFDDETLFFRENPAKAKALLAIGEAELAVAASGSQDEFAELAAMTVVCQAMLNLDVTVWKR